MDFSTATVAGNYKITATTNVEGTCAAGNNFSSTVNGLLSITSVSFYTQSAYIVQLGEGTQNIEYTVLVHPTSVKDVAGNSLDCPNTATFIGTDTVRPYLVNVSNPEPAKVKVIFSEPMTTGGGSTAADNITNYTIEEDPSNGNPTDDVSIISITTVDDTTFILNLDKTVQSIRYKVTVNTNVTDQAPIPNPMGTPSSLTFIGNEALKVILAEAIDLHTVKITFNKPVKPGVDLAGSAECDDAAECHTKYKLFPRTSGDVAYLGDITSVTRGTGNNKNVVYLTHSNDQEGYAYTVVAANARDGDGFDNGTNCIESEANSSEYVQAAPKDRATFVGLGEVKDKIEDGTYFEDPFADGSVFSWSFVYGSKVYLGTNDINNAAFRFEPNGMNAVLVDFDFVDGIIANPACPDSTMFGYGTSPVCGTNMGYNAEYGVVGFNSATLNTGSGDYEILLVGPIKTGVNYGYFTQDLDTTLDWKPFTFSVTGGSNTRSIQTLYGFGDKVYLGFSSDHSQQAPILSYHTVTISDGIVTIGNGTDMNIRQTTCIGKQGSPKNTAVVAGIDSILLFKNHLYLANNGGVAYSGNLDTNYNSDDKNGTPSGFTGTTLQLNGIYGEGNGNNPGLFKVSPGEKGMPKLLEYNGKLYMARNVAQGASGNACWTNLRGELWVCDPSGGSDPNECEPGDWTQLISGTETDLPGSGANGAISLLQNNGSDTARHILYVGFDSPSGVTIWRIDSADPPATSGTMASAGWVRQGVPGLGNSHTKIYSSATINDGTYDYIYVTAGNGSNAIRVYRQSE